MGNSAVKAQRLANEANTALTHETNEYNLAIARENNQWNWGISQAQNDWNIQQWNRENEYNKPAAQMQRYLEAGINPLWAMQDSDAGLAQHLESAQVSPAQSVMMESPSVQPEYDPTRLTNIVAASRDLVNSVQGFQRLALDAEDIDIRRSAQQSQAALNAYEAQYKRALSAGQDLRNAFDTNTFGTRVSSMAQNLTNMKAEYEKLKAEGKNATAQYDNIVASRDLIDAEVKNFKSQCDYRLKQLDIANRQLDIAQQNADTNSAQVDIQRQSLSFDREKWSNQLQKWNNDEIFRWATSFSTKNRARGSGSVSLGSSGTGVGIGASAEFEAQETFANFDVLEAANVQMFKNCMSDPTPENISAYDRFDKYIKAILDDKILKDSQLPSSTIPVSNATILNPSAPWNQ